MPVDPTGRHEGRVAGASRRRKQVKAQREQRQGLWATEGQSAAARGAYNRNSDAHGRGCAQLDSCGVPHNRTMALPL